MVPKRVGRKGARRLPVVFAPGEAAPPAKPGDVPVGFGPKAIAPGETVALTAVVEVRYQIERLLVDKGSAERFSIKGLRVGMASQWASVGAVPAILFTVPGGLPVAAPRAEIGTTITLYVLNESLETATFAGAVFGSTQE